MIRVGMAVPRGRRCGIADYAACVAQAMPPDVSVTWIDLSGLRTGRDYYRAAAAVREIDVALVHYEYALFRHVSPLRNGFAAFMSGLRVPAAVVLHDALPRLDGTWPVPPARRLLLRLLYAPCAPWWEARQYRRAARVIAHTPDIAARAGRFLGADRVLCAPHPVRRVTHTWSPPTDGAVRLVTPGFIKAHKGYDDGLDVLVAHPSWHWVLAGGPQHGNDMSYAAQLREAARTRGVLARLEFTGYLPAPQLEQACVGATAAFFPFRSVTGSGSMTWAIGMGMPVVATDLPPTRWLAAQGAGIALLPADSRASWADGMGNLLGSPAQMADLAGRNRVFAAAHGYDRLASELLPVLRALADTGMARRRP